MFLINQIFTVYRKSSTVKSLMSVTISLCNCHFLFFLPYSCSPVLFLLPLNCETLGKAIHLHKPQNNVIHIQRVIVRPTVKHCVWHTL